jgi:hypothetical protein
MSTQIGNQDVDVDVEGIGNGRVHVLDRAYPWITTRAEWDKAVEALSEQEFSDGASAYQAPCDEIIPIAAGNDAVEMYKVSQ